MADQCKPSSGSDKSLAQIPNKRQRASIAPSEQSCDNSMPHRRGRSCDRCLSRAISPRPHPSSPQPEPSVPAAVEEISFEKEYGEQYPNMDELLIRIYDGIDYMRSQQRKNLPVMQTTCFCIPLPPTTPAEGTALVLLHRAEEDGLATFILESSFYTVYELGIPVPYLVPEGAGVRLIHSPHWWAGKSAAEVKAGPRTEKKDVRRAAGHLKGLATKKEKKVEKSKRVREIESKLVEGLRRQERKEKMCDSDEEGERSWSESDSDSASETELEEMAVLRTS